MADDKKVSIYLLLLIKTGKLFDALCRQNFNWKKTSVCGDVRLYVSRLP